MRKVFFALVALLIVVILLAGCGGGAGANQSGGAQPTSSAGTSGATATTTGGVGASSATTSTGSSSASSATAATGGGAASGGAGDPKAGEALFTSATIGTNPGCKTCHTIDGSKLVGPSLQGIASRAATRVPGQSAEQYIRTSITDPNAYVVPDFPQGVMPSFKTVLSDTQLNDLVAYLMTLK